MQTQTKHFDWNDMNCFVLDVSMWSGRSKMAREDLKDPDAVPPDALASLGSLKLIDPDRLKIFNALKRRALRMLEAHGVTFLNGFVVSADSVDTVDVELVKIRDEYNLNIAKLMADYDGQCDDWLQANSQWAHIIRPRLPSAADIQRKFNFDWTLFKVQPASSRVAHHGSCALEDAKDGLGNTAVDEVSKMLGECARNLLKADRTQYGNNAFNAVDKAIGKCDELAFINPDLGVLSSFLKELKHSVQTSAISADTFRIIFSAVSSPDSIRNVIDLRKADLDIGSLAWALQPTVTPPAQPAPDEVAVCPMIQDVESCGGEDGLDGDDSKHEPFDFEAFNECLKDADAPEELQLNQNKLEKSSLADTLLNLPIPKLPELYVDQPSKDSRVDYETVIRKAFAERGLMQSLVTVTRNIKNDTVTVNYGSESVEVDTSVLDRYPENTAKGTVELLLREYEKKYIDNVASLLKKPDEKSSTDEKQVREEESNGLMNLEGII